MAEPGSSAFIVYANVPTVADPRICPICEEPAPLNQVRNFLSYYCTTVVTSTYKKA